MRFPTSSLRPLVAALAAAVVLTACGGGGGGEGGGEKAASNDTPPSKVDFTEAKTALADLKADYQAVYDAGTKVQKTSVAYFKSHPKGTADDAALESVTTAFDEAVEKRDDAIDEVEDLKALEDTDVAKAYETYSEKAQEGDEFYDTLFGEFPMLQQVFAACGDVFTSAKIETSPSSPADFGRKMLSQYRPAIADCLPALEELSASENANLAAFGSGFTEIVTERRSLMTKLSSGDIAMDAFSAKYKQVAARVNKVGENIDFQTKLNEMSPVQEFLALEKVVAGKIS